MCLIVDDKVLANKVRKREGPPEPAPASPSPNKRLVRPAYHHRGQLLRAARRREAATSAENELLKLQLADRKYVMAESTAQLALARSTNVSLGFDDDFDDF